MLSSSAAHFSGPKVSTSSSTRLAPEALTLEQFKYLAIPQRLRLQINPYSLWLSIIPSMRLAPISLVIRRASLDPVSRLAPAEIVSLPA